MVFELIKLRMKNKQSITIWEELRYKAYKLTECYHLGWELFHSSKNNKEKRNALRSKLHAVIKVERFLQQSLNT